jgi:hypothetical protein
VPLASALQFQDYQYQFQAREGLWRWTTRVDVSGVAPKYEVRDIFSPFGILRDRIPLPGGLVQAMAESIAELQQAFQPLIMLDPLTLVFTLDEGRGFGEGQSVQVTNNGVYGSLLSAAFSTSAGYLKTTPSFLGSLSFNESGLVEVTADSTNLLATHSPYIATLAVQDAAAGNSPQTITVTVVVRPRATIVLSLPMLTFNVVKPPSGSFPPIPSQTFQIYNTGPVDSVLEYLIQKLTGCGTWIVSIDPFQGTLPGGGVQSVMVTVAPDPSIPVGTYTETLRISGYSTNFHQDILVQLNVT